MVLADNRHGNPCLAPATICCTGLHGAQAQLQGHLPYLSPAVDVIPQVGCLGLGVLVGGAGAVTTLVDTGLSMTSMAATTAVIKRIKMLGVDNNVSEGCGRQGCIHRLPLRIKWLLLGPCFVKESRDAGVISNAACSRTKMLLSELQTFPFPHLSLVLCALIVGLGLVGGLAHVAVKLVGRLVSTVLPVEGKQVPSISLSAIQGKKVPTSALDWHAGLLPVMCS
jgi:hypothetical protein